MSKRKDRITPTLAESQAPQEDHPGMFPAPVEIEFHLAGANVKKYETPQGNLTVLNIISPIGIALTIKLSDENIAELVKDLQGEKEEKSSVDVYTALPPGISK